MRKLLQFIRPLEVGMAGLTLLATPLLRAATPVTVVITGGNSSETVLFDRASNILSGFTVTNLPGNSNVRSYLNGTLVSNPNLSPVNLHFILNGGVQGTQDVLNQANDTTANGLQLPPQVAVSSTAPETVGISSASFTENFTLVLPQLYVKYSSVSPDLGSVTNLTQRQAAYLEGAAGTFSSSFLGGSSTSDAVYFVGRNTAAAARAIIDANDYFTGTPASYVTNTGTGTYNGTPVLDPNGGTSAAGAVANNIKLIANSIGYLAPQNISGLTPLAYEGVPFSVANVENGSYPIWGYERFLYLNDSQQGAPSANQLIVINALYSAITNATYQTTSPVFVGNFVPLSGMQVQRSTFADGGPISPLP